MHSAVKIKVIKIVNELSVYLEYELGSNVGLSSVIMSELRAIR